MDPHRSERSRIPSDVGQPCAWTRLGELLANVGGVGVEPQIGVAKMGRIGAAGRRSTTTLWALAVQRRILAETQVSKYTRRVMMLAEIPD